ncbi:MAG TPA: diacylglycerol kinase family protein [Opitutaceae bacterium]|nr:diacylglycerol kinase family protein [Opitutaceae bacterium]
MRSLLLSRVRSFRYALAGLRTLAATQPNFRIHLLATGGVILAGALLGISRGDWLWLAAAVFSVWLAEAFNTALELLADAVTTETHPLIGRAKDCAAAAVLISAAGALVVGGLVLGPRLLERLG